MVSKFPLAGFYDFIKTWRSALRARHQILSGFHSLWPVLQVYLICNLPRENSNQTKSNKKFFYNKFCIKDLCNN